MVWLAILDRGFPLNVLNQDILVTSLDGSVLNLHELLLLLHGGSYPLLLHIDGMALSVGRGDCVYLLCVDIPCCLTGYLTSCKDLLLQLVGGNRVALIG